MDAFSTLISLLDTARRDFAFDTLVLTHANGFPIAHTHGTDSESVAAAGALAGQLMRDVQESASMRVIEECSFSDEAGQRMVCRRFTVGEQPMILVALLDAQRPYRRATTHLIRDVRRLLTEMEVEMVY